MNYEVVDIETINGYFTSLENTNAPSGLLKKRIQISESFGALFIVDASTKLRGIELEFNNQAQLINLPEKINGLDIRLDTQSDNSQKLSLTQIRSSDDILFSTLLQDLLNTSAEVSGEESRTTINRLARWRQFFKVSREGLSIQAQLGLYSELLTLRDLIAPNLGWDLAVEHWHGPSSDVHDFSDANWALEVKATSTKNKTAQISSEVQLDPTFVSRLFLVFYSMDVRSHSAGESLPELIRKIKSQLEISRSALAVFEDKLLEVGYHDVHAHLYPSHYIPTGIQCFEVNDSFPSIRKSMLPLSATGVSYTLHIEHCFDWSISSEEIIEQLIQGLDQ